MSFTASWPHPRHHPRSGRPDTAAAGSLHVGALDWCNNTDNAQPFFKSLRIAAMSSRNAFTSCIAVGSRAFVVVYEWDLAPTRLKMSDDENPAPFHSRHQLPAPPRQPQPGELLFEFAKAPIAIAWNSVTTARPGARRRSPRPVNCGRRAGSSIATGRRSGPSACARKCCEASTRGREQTGPPRRPCSRRLSVRMNGPHRGSAPGEV